MSSSIKKHVFEISRFSSSEFIFLCINSVAEATESDPKMHMLKQAVHKGHLDTMQHPQLKKYAKFFEALSIIDRVTCRAEKILVPESLQEQVVEIAHEAHQGITKTKQYV